PDFFTNALTIIAKEADLRAMEQIIAKLDEAAKDNNLRVRVIPVTQMKASKLAELLERVYSQMTESKIVLTNKLPPRERDTTTVQPSIPPLPGMFDEEGDSPLKAEPSTAPPPATRPAGGAGAQETPDASARPPITIAVDESANALIVSATRQELENIETLIAQLLVSSQEADAEIRVYKIKWADPVSVAQTLDHLFNPRPVAAPQQPQRQQGDQPRTPRQPAPAAPAAKPVITVVADQRTRSVFVLAKSIHFERIEEIIKQIDQTTTAVSEIRVFTLKNTDAAEVAANLRELFRMSASAATTPAPAPAGGTRGRATPQQQRVETVRQMIELRSKDTVTKFDAATMISITANRQTNSVVVAAPADAMGLVEQLIQELDQSAALSKVPAVRLYPLKHAEVRTTVSSLQQIFAGAPRDARTRVATAREEPVVIAGDEAGRLVIVSAPVEKHELIAKVIEDIDRAQGGDQVSVRVYSIQHADAAGVATALNVAVGGASTDRRTRTTESSAGIRISADSSSNCLIVRASQEDHERIAELIAKMDVAPTAQFPVQAIPLNHADATEVARVLGRVFAQPSGRGRTGRSAAQGVVIEADRTARMLMVRADEQTFEKIRQLAAQLDATSPAGQASRTLIPLKSAQALSVAAALTQAFAPQRGERISPDDLVTVVAEPISNSVIVTANDQNLAKVLSVLEKLDTDAAGGMRMEFVLLKNAKATDLEKVLSAMVGGERGREQPGVKVSAEPGSNALIISGPSGQMDRFVQMAMQLDQAAVSTATGVYVIPLETGDAVEVAAMIRSLYNQQVQAARLERKTVEAMAVTADERANAVVVAGSKEMYEQVSQL
ncbi:MAG TPA: secretin N-terminal domain-containing protein, partial [Phycisphaerae bacterium]|nr:secretin N-terminal domain-containing protein [Phycisphaerae bacterium]